VENLAKEVKSDAGQGGSSLAVVDDEPDLFTGGLSTYLKTVLSHGFHSRGANAHTCPVLSSLSRLPHSWLKRTCRASGEKPISFPSAEADLTTGANTSIIDC